MWGQLRPAAHNTTQYGVIEFQRKGSSSWKELTEVQTDSPEGFIYNHVSILPAGNVRLGWLDPDGSRLLQPRRPGQLTSARSSRSATGSVVVS